MHPILRLASFAAALAMLCFVPGCGEGNCAATCETLLTVDFTSPIGQPGSYLFQIGTHECQVDLPTTRPTCGRMQDRSIVGFAFAEKAPSGPLNVVVIKDGVEILRVPATLVTQRSFKVCGQTCYEASFRVQVPKVLPPPRSPCGLENLSGTYTVKTDVVSGSCPRIFGGETVSVDNGLLVMADSTCESRVTAWDPSTCALRSLTTCDSSEGKTSWILDVMDLVGDGTVLEGQVEVSHSAGCWGSTAVRLSR